MDRAQESSRITAELTRGEPRRVGIIGHHSSSGRGGHGTHLAFSGLPGAKIVSVADPDEQGRKKLQEETGAENCRRDWRELLEKDRPEFICVCSRLPARRAEVVIAAAETGCHVYCEKPLAENLEEADRIIAAADAGGSRIAVAHLGRYAPVFHTARTMIQGGDIGRPLSVYCRGKEDERGGGEDMLVLGSHLFDLSRFFFGNPEWIFGHVTTGGRSTAPGDAREPTEPVGPVAGDEIIGIFGFPSGVRGYFESRRALADGKTTRMGIRIRGSEAVLSFRYDDKRQLRVCRGGASSEEADRFETVPTPQPPEIPGAEPLTPPGESSGKDFYFASCNRLAAADLMLAAAEGREPLSSARDARWALEMVFGIYASHFSGRALRPPAKNRKHPLSGETASSAQRTGGDERGVV